MTAAYPLQWPEGFPRSKSRETGKFKTTLAGALKNVRTSLDLFSKDSGKRVEFIVLSSNVTLGAERPTDSGVAVWFTWDGLQLCIPVDRYSTPEANLQAIHHVIEARRTEMRHGTLALVRATMTGFRALPAPGGRHWRSVLDLPSDMAATPANIETAYRRLALVRHPDRPTGSTAMMAELNAARDAALKEIA
jgi:hypothetical protein